MLNVALPEIAEGPASVTVQSPAGTFGGTRIKADGTRSVEPIAQLDAGQRKILAGRHRREQPRRAGIPDPLRDLLSESRFSERHDCQCQLGDDAPVYAGPAGQYPGLDQMNLLLPASLAGKGQVYVVIAIGDLDNEANLVWLQIK